MSWTPISNTVPQYEDAGIPASGFYLKFYLSGTVTPTPMATDSTGITALDKAQLNVQGYPINGSNAVFIPHIDRKYKLILYRNATDADNNTTVNAVWVVDELFPVSTESSSITVFNTVAEAISSTNNVGATIQTLGYTTANDGGGADYIIVAGGTGTDDGGSFLNMNSGLQLQLIFNDVIDIRQFGAVDSISVPSTLSIQNAINFGSSKSLVVYGRGVFGVDATNTLNSITYSLLMSSNHEIDIDQLFLISGSNSTVMLWDETIADTNIKINRLSIDGNALNNPSASAGFFLINATNVDIGYLKVVETNGFAILIRLINGLRYDNLIAENQLTTASNDGVHFFDVDNVVGGSIWSACGGDDAVALSALTKDMSNIILGNITCVSTNPGSTPQGNRGVLLNLADGAASTFSISNVQMNIVAENLAGPALLLFKGQFENIQATVNSKGCKSGLGIDIGDGASINGYVRNSSFTVLDVDSTQGAMTMSIASGSDVTDNEIDFKSRHTTDGFSGVILRGNSWTGSVAINHDPDSAKSNPLNAVDLFCIDSDLSIKANGGDRNINIRFGAIDNVLRLGQLTNAVDKDIVVNSTADRTSFSGGSITSEITDAGIETLFTGVRGANNKGSDALTPDGSGVATIAHGLVGVPSIHSVSFFGSGDILVNVTQASATDLTLAFKDSSATPVTTGTHTIKWEAALN